MTIKDQWREMTEGEDPYKDLPYNRNKLLRAATALVKTGRPQTSDYAATTVGRFISSLILSEYRWLDVQDGVNKNARD